MKIAMVTNGWFPVSPNLGYNGLEASVLYLINELVSEGHEVVLYSHPDSVTAATLISPYPGYAYRMESQDERVGYEVILLTQLLADADRYDIVHMHFMPIHALVMMKDCHVPVVYTLHNPVRYQYPKEEDPLLTEGLAKLLRPCIFVSHDQKASFQESYSIPCYTVIHWGLPHHQTTLPEFSYEEQNYLAYLAFMSENKGAHMAVEAMNVLDEDKRLLMAGGRDEQFWQSEVAPYVDGKRIKYLGVIKDQELKKRFLCGAEALLVPVQWPEPFGITLIEAMAMGTPVIGTPMGALNELVVEGKTGFLVHDLAELPDIIEKAKVLDRQVIRQHYQDNFSMKQCAENHLAYYREVISQYPAD